MIGTVLGNRYEILSEIGSGGMAKVYKARCRYLQRIVAVKVLKDEFRGDSEFLKRFDTEAQAAASLTHPNIVQIYDVGRDNNRYYIVMEYVDGITLKEYIEQRGALEWREAINISIQICSALSKAHSRQIIHRDIKPHNIIMTSDGVPKVADFGIARSVSSQTATMKIETVGSVHYSSPEQVRGGYTDAQSDIYSIGVCIFEMVTGKLPFDGDNPVTVALKHIQDEPPVPSSIKQGIPQALNRIILKAMAKSRQERYNSVADLINDLENIRSKPNAAAHIVLPNVKHDNKYDTKKIEKLGDEELRRSSTSRQPAPSNGQGNGRKFLMPILYLTLILTILGSIGYFVTMVLGELLDPEDRPRDFTVGTYRGRDIEEVKKELELAGVVPEIVYEPSDTVDENVVINQDPVPDATMKIPGLTKLILTVSKGMEMVEIPTLKNKDHNEMKFHLTDDLGLVVEEVPEYNPEVASNLIIRSDPAEGTEVKKGSKITVYWSMGPEKKEVVVPELRDLTYEQALNRLNEHKLKMGKTFPEGRQGYTGKIVDQAPKAGETVVEDTAIDIYFESEAASQTGDNTSLPAGTHKTIMIYLPQGEYNFGNTVRFRAYVTDNKTGEEVVLFDESNFAVSNFPRSIVVPIVKNSSITLRVYINDLLVKEEAL